MSRLKVLSLLQIRNQKKNKMATYTNTALGETYKIGGVKSLAQAWKLAEYVAEKNGWNFETFSIDVKVRFEK